MKRFFLTTAGPILALALLFYFFRPSFDKDTLLFLITVGGAVFLGLVSAAALKSGLMIKKAKGLATLFILLSLFLAVLGGWAMAFLYIIAFVKSFFAAGRSLERAASGKNALLAHGRGIKPEKIWRCYVLKAAIPEIFAEFGGLFSFFAGLLFIIQALFKTGAGGGLFAVISRGEYAAAFQSLAAISAGCVGAALLSGLLKLVFERRGAI